MQTEQQPQPQPLRSIVLIASIAAGVQFGWALQLSLLTPYVQLLGIPHRWASLIWLCGPISGLVVQPIAGHCSDRCTSRFGRRRPFIAAGTALVSIAVVLIGYAADIGRLLGDPPEKTPKTRAITIFAVGFWILDVANNMLQGPCRAFLADLSADSEKKTQIANGLFSFFMAVGHVLGFAAGSYGRLHNAFPWTTTKACDVYCANLKSCFLVSVFLLLILTVTALRYVREKPWSPEFNENAASEDETDFKKPLCGGICVSVKDLKRPMWMLLIVTALNWTAWFPFLLFDTDWMGREVYGGDSAGTGNTRLLYDRGVRTGTFGLMLTAIVVGLVSLGVERLARALGGITRLWSVANFLLAICLAATVLITKLADSNRRFMAVPVTGGGYSPAPPSLGVKSGALTLFALLGIPQAITHIIPFALASVYSSRCGAGQGLSMGVLNIAISAPQLVISVGAGPFDDLFGGGNLPGFIAGAVAAAASGVLALTLLS